MNAVRGVSMNRTASDFFDSSGTFTRTARLVLRRPDRGDLLAYVRTFPDGLRREYLREDDSGEWLRSSYWEDVSSEASLFCTIVDGASGGVCGFCSIEKLAEDPSEIGIRLLPEWRGRGLGTEAVSALMHGVELVAGPTEFVAEIDSDNKASQRLFRRLGFVPAGVDTPIFKDPEFLTAFEESHLGLIDDHLRALADEFAVEPRTLLSHALVFRRPATRE